MGKLRKGMFYNHQGLHLVPPHGKEIGKKTLFVEIMFPELLKGSEWTALTVFFDIKFTQKVFFTSALNSPLTKVFIALLTHCYCLHRSVVFSANLFWDLLLLLI